MEASKKEVHDATMSVNEYENPNGTRKSRYGIISEQKEQPNAETLRAENEQRTKDRVLETYFRYLNEEQPRIADARELLVKYTLEKIPIKSIRDDNTPEMWYWMDDGLYHPNAECRIHEVLRGLLGKYYTSRIGKEVIDSIKASTGVDADTFFSTTNPLLLPCKNGVYNIETKELEFYHPDRVFFSTINANYDPKAKYDEFQKFVDDVCPHQYRLILQEMAGYCLWRDYNYHKFFILTGVGRNGKSTFLDILTELLGTGNVVNIPLQELANNDFAKGQLHNQMACIVSDLGKGGMDDTHDIKSLTGNDRITANRKYKSHQKFRSYAKLIYSANTLPYIDDDSDGFMLRIILIDFPHKFYTPQELALNANIKEAMVADPFLTKKLTTPVMMSGILNWALDGLYRLQANNGFSQVDSMDSIRSIVELKSNNLAYFFDHYVVRDVAEHINKDEFRAAYHTFCKTNNMSPVSDVKIANYLGKRDIGTGRMRDGAQRYRFWEGITWADDCQVDGKFVLPASLAKFVKEK